MEDALLMADHTEEFEARFRRATIDFLLAVGEVDDLSRVTTAEAIAELVKRGVDYDQSATPTFGTVWLDEGGTEVDGFSIEAFTAEVVPVGAGKYTRGYREAWTFYVPHEVLSKHSFPVLVGLLAAEESLGTRSWKDRFQ